jgi:hypothetical protein
MTISSSESTTNLSNIGVIHLSLGDWEDPPSSFVLSVTCDDGTTINRTITPDYSIDEPNGAGCGKRKQANTIVQL